MITSFFLWLFRPKKVVAIVLERVPVWDDYDKIVAWKEEWRVIKA